MAKQATSDRTIVRYLATGAAWEQHKLHNIDSNKCLLCGQEESSIAHGLWQCPEVLALGRHIRQQQHSSWQRQKQQQAEQADEQQATRMLEQYYTMLTRSHDHSPPPNQAQPKPSSTAQPTSE